MYIFSAWHITQITKQKEKREHMVATQLITKLYQFKMGDGSAYEAKKT